MKGIDNKTIIIAAIALIAGLGMGWLISSTGSTAHDGHEHVLQEVSETWTCSMHPQIRQPEAGSCPICGMDLIPVDVSDDGDPMEVKMSPTAMQLASVQTEVVSKKSPVKEVLLSGKIQADESTIVSQTSHLSGRIERLLINTTGEYVSKGQIIGYIYSPELVTAQKELFEAEKIKTTNPELFNAAQEKLKNWKLSDNQIQSVLEAGVPIENFPIQADYGGIVLAKKVELGDHVMQGSALYEIASLSRVWVLFDIYENDMPWVKVGDKVDFEVQSFPGQQFSGTISFIDPVINPKTRVSKARLVIQNKKSKLKPEMFVSGVLQSPTSLKEEAIIIPKSAVMWTGTRSVVYVKSRDQNGLGFVMREITTAASLGKAVVVKEGLIEGEEIATHGTFSIDAAAQLAGKPSMMNPDGGIKMTGHNHGQMSSENQQKVVPVSKKGKDELQPLYEPYLSFKDALVDDDWEAAKKAGMSFNTSLNEVNMAAFEGETRGIWMKHATEMKKAMEHIHHLTTIEEVRKVFQTISTHMIIMTTSLKSNDQPLHVQFCPMADDNKGASWLSLSDEILNPYFGESMLTCGEVTNTLP